MGTTFTGVPVIQLDDNLQNGRTYTFQFKCQNWFCLSDLSADLSKDIYENAPDFLTSVQVTSPPTTSLYNVQFTYEGDGSDVVSDVAGSLVAAFKIGSNDDLAFVGGVQTGTADIIVTPSAAAQATEQAATKAVSKVATDVTTAATDAVNAALKGLMPLLIVVVLIVLFVLPSFMKSTGTRVSVG